MFNLTNDQITQLLVIVGVAVLLVFLIKTYYYDSPSVQEPTQTPEGFYDYDESSPVQNNVQRSSEDEEEKMLEAKHKTQKERETDKKLIQNKFNR